MEIVDHALHALSDEVLVPHSGWERGSNGAGGGEENCKPRHLEWETALTNTAGCLRYGQLLEKRGEHLLNFKSHSLVLKYTQKPPLLLFHSLRGVQPSVIHAVLPEFSERRAGVIRAARGH